MFFEYESKVMIGPLVCFRLKTFYDEVVESRTLFVSLPRTVEIAQQTFESGRFHYAFNET